jgi:DNA-binding transcriptional ArsR family regulator
MSTNENGIKKWEKTLKALANQRRLGILSYLERTGEANVGFIAAEIHLSFKSTSRHLAILKAAGIVDRTQKDLQAFYKIARPSELVVECVLSGIRYAANSHELGMRG